MALKKVDKFYFFINASSYIYIYLIVTFRTDFNFAFLQSQIFLFRGGLHSHNFRFCQIIAIFARDKKRSISNEKRK